MEDLEDLVELAGDVADLVETVLDALDDWSKPSE